MSEELEKIELAYKLLREVFDSDKKIPSLVRKDINESCYGIFMARCMLRNYINSVDYENDKAKL